MPERNIYSSEWDSQNGDLLYQPLIFRLSVYVLESSNSRRLTYFMPPLVS